MKKKTILLSVVVAAFLLIAYMIFPGFCKNTTVFLSGFTVSDDGSEMTVTVGVASSVGAVRKVELRRHGSDMAELIFYSAFGGLNGKLGAKGEFTISLDGITELSIRRADGRTEKTLVKTDGVWTRVSQS